LGSFVASLGLWIQTIALGWVVYDLTGSTTWLGAISFAGNAPTFVFGLLGGAVADRASRRTMMATALMVLSASAAALALLTAIGHLAVWYIVGLAIVSGIANAVYTPTMHATVPSLVPPDDLLSAISLTSVQFNLARTLGPVVAGTLYARIGPAGCFGLNAAGFLVLVGTLFAIALPGKPVGASLPMGQALRAGLRYARRHAVIGPLIVVAFVMSLFGFPYIILMAALARDVLHLDPSGLGFMMGSVGFGAVLGGLGLSAAGDFRHKGLAAAGGAAVFGCVLAGIAWVHEPRTMAGLLLVLGFVQTIAIASLTTCVQLTVEDGMRGRVMSMLTVILFGVATLGGFILGFAADRFGVAQVLSTGGVIVAVASTGVMIRARRLWAPVHA
jgi:MFS family permease